MKNLIKGMFDFFSSSSSQQSMQSEMNQNMLNALQAQLQTTTWPTARNQLIAQIAKLQQQMNVPPPLMVQPPPQPQQAQPPTQAQQPTINPQMPPQATQAPLSLSPQKLMELSMLENELNTIKQAIIKMEASIKKVKE